MNGTKEGTSWNEIDGIFSFLLQKDFNARRKTNMILTNEENYILHDCETIRLYICYDETSKVYVRFLRIATFIGHAFVMIFEC